MKMNNFERTVTALRYFQGGANLSRLSRPELHRLAELKKSVVNVGGESGISMTRFDRAADWLESLIEQRVLSLPLSWPSPDCR